MDVLSNDNAIEPHWWKVNIDSGNVLVPSGNKLLPEPMLTNIYDGIWLHYELKRCSKGMNCEAKGRQKEITQVGIYRPLYFWNDILVGSHDKIINHWKMCQEHTVVGALFFTIT